MAFSLVALNDTQLQAQVCSSEMSHCVALCPNQDLAGIGVRLAFYIQSFMSALLVVFSPSDSVPTAWAGTLLTASLVIAAFVQESRGNLTLHHAALILNFSTLSCISSLAVAPTLPIWRLTPGEYYEHDRTQHVLSQRSDELRNVFTSAVYSNAHKKRLRIEQKRSRVVLALALLLQVTFQWSWGIFLFVSWQNYSQPECSGGTTLVMFLASFTVKNINNLDMHGVKFLIWPLWIFCSLGITLALTILLALSSPYRAQAVFSRSTNATTAPSATTPVFIAWAHIARQAIPSWKDKARLLTMASYIVSFVLWSIYVASSELQKARNRIFDGENDFGGFGQITAICVSLAPLWSLTVALYKYPSRRRRRDRHHARLQCLSSAILDGAPSAFDVISPAVSRRTTRYFPEPPRRGTRHIPMPSDASSDEYEMYAVPPGRDSYVRLPTMAESPPMPRRSLNAERVRRATVRGPRPPPSRT